MKAIKKRVVWLSNGQLFLQLNKHGRSSKRQTFFLLVSYMKPCYHMVSCEQPLQKAHKSNDKLSMKYDTTEKVIHLEISLYDNLIQLMYLQCIVMYSVGLQEKGIFNAKIPKIPQV